MVDFSVIPLIALSEKTKQLISVLLNPPKIIPTEHNILRDWRGLANEVSIGSENLPLLANCNDPTGYIIAHMQKQNKCMFLDLQKILEKLDRWDILNDVEVLFEHDAKFYLEEKGKAFTKAKIIENDVDSQILTVDDLYRYKDGLENMHYDAFLLYAEEDYDFANQIVDYLENNSKLKLCIKDRNLMPGLSFTYDAIMQLISERCNRLIVILSPNFLVSEENAFFLNYAQAIGIDKRLRKIVPCMYKRCELPLTLRYMYILDYNRAGFYDFWGKLRDSVKIATNNELKCQSVTLPSIQSEVEDRSLNKTMKQEVIADNKNEPKSQMEDKDISIAFPSVSHLEDPGASEQNILKNKSKQKKYLSIYKKKLQSLLSKS